MPDGNRAASAEAGAEARPFGGEGTSVKAFTPMEYLRCWASEVKEEKFSEASVKGLGRGVNLLTVGLLLCFRIAASRSWNSRRELSLSVLRKSAMYFS